jgi:hypothetical protein
MTLDERLERLTERHEALTQTVELMAMENRQRDRRLGEIMEGIASLLRPRVVATDIAGYRTGGARHDYRLIGGHSVIWRQTVKVDRFRIADDPAGSSSAVGRGYFKF